MSDHSGREVFREILLMAAFAVAMLLCARLLLGEEYQSDGCRPGQQVAAQIAGAVPRVIHTVQLGDRRLTMPCSGVLVWKSEEADLAVVLTAAHLFTDGVGQVEVHFADGRRFLADVPRDLIDQTWDLAALLIRRPATAPLQIEQDLPRPGESVALYGYPRGGPLRTVAGKVLGMAGPGRGEPLELLDCALSVEQGDSGAPILNREGRVVAMVSGCDFAQRPRTCGASCAPLRKILAAAIIAARGIGRAGNALRPGLILPKRPPVSVGSGPAAPTTSTGPKAPAGVCGSACPTIAAVNLRGEKGDRGEQGPPGPPGPPGNPGPEIEKQIGLLRRSSEAGPGVERIKEVGREAAVAVVVDRLPAAATGTITALLVSLGIPGGAAAVGGVAAAWLLTRGVRKGLNRLESRLGGRTTSSIPPAAQARPQPAQPVLIPIRDDAPPPPQVITREHSYVPYEVPTKRQRAVEMAMDEYVRRYPGARTAVDAINEFARQFESGLEQVT